MCVRLILLLPTEQFEAFQVPNFPLTLSSMDLFFTSLHTTQPLPRRSQTPPLGPPACRY
jgi:hypothetical protein